MASEGAAAKRPKQPDARAEEDEVVNRVLTGPNADPLWAVVEKEKVGLFDNCDDAIEGVYTKKDTNKFLRFKGGVYAEGGINRQMMDDENDGSDEIPPGIPVTLHVLESESTLPEDETMKEELVQVTRDAERHFQTHLPEGYQIISIIPGRFIVVSPTQKVFEFLVERMPF
jgi:hypothetical protein